MIEDQTSPSSLSTVASPGSSWALPYFLTEERKWPAAGIVFIIAAGSYLASNHFHLYPPQLLPMTAFDSWVPFIPSTVWIYVSEYVYFFIIYAICKEMRNMTRYLYAFVALQTISVAIFLFLPTTYPRELFPLPSDLDWLTAQVFANLRVTDSPANCCPSLHVSSVFLTSFLFIDEQRKKFLPFFTWGVLIAISTLTTKQHYWIDVVAGIALASAMYWLFHRALPYREPNPAAANR